MKPADYSVSINGFRGVCVMLVFLHHVANSGLPPAAASGVFWQESVAALFMSFAYGVELFFMISGYVIVKSLARHQSIAGFLYDRVVRIFPVWLPLAIVLCLASGLAGRPGYDLGDLGHWIFVTLGNVLLLPPLAPLPLVHPASWSLSYEWIFYGAGALAAFLWRRAGAVPWRWLWAAAVALLVACFPRALFFLPGVLLALRPVWVQPLQRAPAFAGVSLFVFLASWYATGVTESRFDKPLWAVVAEGNMLAAAVALIAATHLFALVVQPPGSSLAILRTRAVQHLGDISYSFYLLHPVAMALVKRALYSFVPDAQGSWGATFVFALASFLLAWVLAYVSWRLLEQRLARWLKARVRRAPAVRPAMVEGRSA